MKNLKSLVFTLFFAALAFSLSGVNLFAQELEELQEEKFETKKETKKEEPKAPEKEVKKEQVTPNNDIKPLEEKKVVVETPPQQNVAGIPEDIKINPEDIRPLFKDKYEYLFDAGFETVYKSVLKAIEERGCQVAQKNTSQDDKGLQKASIKSDDCVFSIGEDSTFKVLRKFSLLDDRTIEKDGQKVVIGKGIPNIRGGKWLNGRLKYNFKLLEQNDGKTMLTMKTEMSGFEDYVTHEVNFWSSNGLLETYMLNTLFKHLRIEKGQ